MPKFIRVMRPRPRPFSEFFFAGQNRQFQVRFDSHMSNVFKQEMGVPQGSILSVTLFALKINSIVKSLSSGVECSLYVDNFLICYRSKFVHIIERHLQRSLNKLQHWVDSNGFKFSPTKTVCVHFAFVRRTLIHSCCSTEPQFLWLNIQSSSV